MSECRKEIKTNQIAKVTMKTVTLDDAIQTALQTQDQLAVPLYAFLVQMKSLGDRIKQIDPADHLDDNLHEIASIRGAYTCLLALELIDVDDYAYYIDKLKELEDVCNDTYFSL